MVNTFGETFVQNIHGKSCRSPTGDATGLIISRVLFGFLQGPLVPSIAYFAVAWFPIEERGRVSAVCFIGVNVSQMSNFQHKNRNFMLTIK